MIVIAGKLLYSSFAESSIALKVSFLPTVQVPPLTVIAPGLSPDTTKPAFSIITHSAPAGIFIVPELLSPVVIAPVTPEGGVIPTDSPESVAPLIKFNILLFFYIVSKSGFVDSQFANL